MIAHPPPLGVLDLSPIPSGSDGRTALTNTLDLARAAERFGYSRHWLAEHHNTPGMASSAPEIMVGQVAAATERIRVGAGGIMLPNHSPLHVAESFRVLHALYPGRIELGIGRAPGTDSVTASALRRRAATVGAEEFPEQMYELLAYAGDGFPADHPYAGVHAEPRDVALPPIWMLASSEYGARAGGALGGGLACARYLNPRDTAAIAREYRETFQPSPARPEPRLILAVSVVVADSARRADELVMSGALGLLRMRKGFPAPVPTPEEALAHEYSDWEQDQVRRYLRAQVYGEPMVVRERLRELVAETGADELLVMSTIHDHAERVRSYELLAEAWGLR